MDKFREILNLDTKSKIKKVKKGELLQREGEFNSMGFYVIKGLLRSYSIDEKGKEHIFMFGSEGWLIADIESQEFDKSTALYIDALEDSEILIFDRKFFALTYLTEKQLKENARLMARRIAMLQRRVMMLMSTSAKERYYNFLETYPKLINRVPQRMIASYLGITPQALSTIRGKIAKEK